MEPEHSNHLENYLPQSPIPILSKNPPADPPFHGSTQRGDTLWGSRPRPSTFRDVLFSGRTVPYYWSSRISVVPRVDTTVVCIRSLYGFELHATNGYGHPATCVICYALSNYLSSFLQSAEDAQLVQRPRSQSLLADVVTVRRLARLGNDSPPPATWRAISTLAVRKRDLASRLRKYTVLSLFIPKATSYSRENNSRIPPTPNQTEPTFSKLIGLSTEYMGRFDCVFTNY
ncbi:hypothetical protein P168DRAFT_277583 [Aspergillus campestris IBT 28561]|uniref:Uncharacterized protein n=1 Tax=Aspergillus campestris (strain IBT 28561) TaxID=1392248 RepID=A0A2I1DDJ7_ASPC2|nr:uncharacterized protein P168DRAFT_277583 [Aspergillus campestris IBT 28561]PKY07936.1 hypothetical protein P168DRAFT_277583 [Aspergillus campestris IBT 28561]